MLARWISPEKGFIAPGRFIPVAEQSLLVTEITKTSFSAASRYANAMRELGLGNHVHIAINVSGEDVSNPNFPSDLALVYRTNTKMLQQLVLEITETAVIQDLGAAIPVLETLREMGVRIAIDDFGTGYLSLSHLQQIPADILKIDQTFVRGILDSPTDEALVRRTLDLARDLGLETVAEGVETQEIADWLRGNGCDKLQGYWYAKPMPFEEWVDWVKAHSRGELEAAQ